MLKPIQKTSLASSVFQQVRAHILDGSMKPGDSLPAERQLAETLGVNRSAVREALKRLEQAGLIAIQHGGNTRVLDYRRHAGLGVLVALVEGDAKCQADVRAFRAAVLPEVCRAAAAAIRASQVARLEMLTGLMASDDEAQRQDLVSEYWNVLVEASGNLAFRLVYNTLEKLPAFEPVPPEAFVDLTNAVAAGDTRGAAVAARGMFA